MSLHKNLCQYVMAVVGGTLYRCNREADCTCDRCGEHLCSNCFAHHFEESHRVNKLAMPEITKHAS